MILVIEKKIQKYGYTGGVGAIYRVLMLNLSPLRILEINELRSPRIVQVRVRLITDTLSQTLHRAGALCTGNAL